MRLAASLLLVAVACGSAAAPDPNRSTGLSIRTSGGTVTLEVQVADSPTERQTGLMGRETLEPYDGMAFVGKPSEPFWMRHADPTDRVLDDPADHLDPRQIRTADPCSSYGPANRSSGRASAGDVQQACRLRYPAPELTPSA
jgi:hypothetical protein